MLSLQVYANRKKKKNQFHTLIIVFLKRGNKSSTFIYQIPAPTFTAWAAFDSWYKSQSFQFSSSIYVHLCFVLSEWHKRSADICRQYSIMSKASSKSRLAMGEKNHLELIRALAESTT